MRRLVLGIETSCDETAAAVYCASDGIRSSVLFSQIAVQAEYGGVVPEIAARLHLEKIDDVIQQALDQAQITLNDVDVIAVTTRPGLAGALLIGLCFAKAVAWAKNIKIIGVNHLEGHAFSSFLEHSVPFSHLCLTASGGHTSLYKIDGFGEYQVLGQTRDDAAGEAFDKIAKLLHLSYPGGPVIETLAQEMGFQDVYEYPRGTIEGLDFSFSGLKTAVMYDLVKRGFYAMDTKKFTGDAAVQHNVASSLLVCIKDIFSNRIMRALEQYPEIKAVTFVGGVACNKYLTRELKNLCHTRRIEFYSPSPRYCTDNGAMIALVGNYKAQQGKVDDLSLDIY